MNPHEFPQHMIDAMSTEDRKRYGLQSSQEREAVLSAINEKALQEAVEDYLTGLGFRKRTNEMSIFRGRPERGWFMHLNRTKGNALLLDLLIWAWDRPALELELKNGNTPMEPHQSELVQQGAKLARNLAEAKAIIEEWLR